MTDCALVVQGLRFRSFQGSVVWIRWLPSSAGGGFGTQSWQHLGVAEGLKVWGRGAPKIMARAWDE